MIYLLKHSLRLIILFFIATFLTEVTLSLCQMYNDQPDQLKAQPVIHLSQAINTFIARLL